MVANPVEQSSSVSHYGYSTLPDVPPSQMTSTHGIDTLYPTDVYGRLVAVSATPALCMYTVQLYTQLCVCVQLYTRLCHFRYILQFHM